MAEGDCFSSAPVELLFIWCFMQRERKIFMLFVKPTLGVRFELRLTSLTSNYPTTLLSLLPPPFFFRERSVVGELTIKHPLFSHFSFFVFFFHLSLDILFSFIVNALEETDNKHCNRQCCLTVSG